MLKFRSPLQKESSDHGNYSDGVEELPVAKLTDAHYLNILQSMGQSVYTYDLNAKITYWNRNAEKLYGYAVPEALGRDLVELIADVEHVHLAADIIDVVSAGESWTGKFSVKSKRGEKFVVIATHTPVYDDSGTLFGIICISSDLWNCKETRCEPQVAMSFSNMASKMNDMDKSGTWSRYNTMDSEGRSGDEATSSRVRSPRIPNAPKSVSGAFFNSDHVETSHFKHQVQSDFKEPTDSNFTESQCMNIFQSMGQSVHIMDRNYRIIFWNRGAEQIYGYTDLEALGCDVRELLAEAKDFQHATNIIDLSFAGEVWSGNFPVTSKKGEKIVIVATASPLYDDNGTLFAVISTAADTREFQKSRSQPFPTQFQQDLSVISRPECMAPQQPIRVVISSKLSDLVSTSNSSHSFVRTSCSVEELCVSSMNEYRKQASKVNNKVKAKWSGEKILEPESRYSHFSNNMEDAKDLSILREIPPSVFGSFFQPSPNARLPIKCPRDYFNYFLAGVEGESRLGSIPTGKSTSTSQSGLWSPPSSINCTSYTSDSATITQLDIFNYDDCSNYKISWKDVKIGKQVGQGSCGTVYHGQWNRSDVAIKVFSAQGFSDDLILSFSQEVSFMKKLQHPNILPFIGSLTSSDHMCIVSEFLARGSLFRLLHRSNSKLDWRRRVLMALEIAQGMNYLHQCTPPIIHHNLKSSNVLVGKNWNVKVGDYGLSHLKHRAFLSVKTGKGTPQWMAPEVMRTTPSNEKSDIYSFGVILWELVTRKIPWDTHNPTQVIGAVGFMDRRLDIPKDTDPQWAAMIHSCWMSDPELRPTFEDLLEKLEFVNRQCVLAAVGQR